MAISAESILASAIHFPLDPVTTSFAAGQSLSLEAAAILERECKRYLWVTWLLTREKREAPGSPALPDRLVISKELEWLDRYWHHFFGNHPELYQEFCIRHFDGVIEHVEEKDAVGKSVTRVDLRRQLEYLYDRIGAEGVKRWYFELQGIA